MILNKCLPSERSPLVYLFNICVLSPNMFSKSRMVERGLVPNVLQCTIVAWCRLAFSELILTGPGMQLWGRVLGFDP